MWNPGRYAGQNKVAGENDSAEQLAYELFPGPREPAGQLGNEFLESFTTASYDVIISGYHDDLHVAESFLDNIGTWRLFLRLNLAKSQKMGHCEILSGRKGVFQLGVLQCEMAFSVRVPAFPAKAGMNALLGTELVGSQGVWFCVLANHVGLSVFHQWRLAR